MSGLAENIRGLCVLATLFLMASCAQFGEDRRPLLAEPEISANLIPASRESSPERILDIAILRFGIDRGSEKKGGQTAAVGDRVFKDILNMESQYLPTVLRKTLQNSNQWGVIRVLPKADLSMDVSLQGTIIRSDGAVLKLHVLAEDSTGREWLNRVYARTNLAGSMDKSQKKPVSGDPLYLPALYSSDSRDPFQELYDQIANDLFVVQQSLTDAQRLNIKRVAEIRHASDLSPEAFSSLLTTDKDGLRRVSRLLADNDPMLVRIARMRLRHNVFIDTLDDYYLELNRSMQPVYDLWRRHSREQILDIENELRGGKGSRGQSKNVRGFTAIANNYYRYKANKLFEQEWAELASGFTSELEPTILELNNQVYGLSGSVEDQYVQWRKILKEFYLYERGY